MKATTLLQPPAILEQGAMVQSFTLAEDTIHVDLMTRRRRKPSFSTRARRHRKHIVRGAPHISAQRKELSKSDTLLCKMTLTMLQPYTNINHKLARQP